MSASSVCPQCSGSTFRSTDGGRSYALCECFEFDDKDELDEQIVFKLLHDAIVTSGCEAALNRPEFCGTLLSVAKAALKITKDETR